MENQAFELAWGERSHSSYGAGLNTTAAYHVKQELGVHHQAAGDLGVDVVDGLEAGHDDLEKNEPDSALPTDGDHVLDVDEHGHLCRRAELIRTHNNFFFLIQASFIHKRR